MNKDNSGFAVLKTLMVVVLVLIAAAAAAYGTYVWQHGKVNDLNNKVSSLNARVDSLNKQVSVLGTQLNKTCLNQANSACAPYSYTSVKGVSILVFTPQRNQKVSSPVPVVGEVPGNWSYEAQFPLQLKNNQGTVIAQTTAHVLGDWMSAQPVPFSAQLTYSSTQPPSGSGSLVLLKDNPSGLAKNSDSLTIPISF